MRHSKQHDAKVFLLAARFLIGAPQVLNIHCAKAPSLRSKGAFLFSSSPEEKGSGTPKGADFSTAATVVAARVLPDALAFRRSTAVLASGI
jgi:hypothetical protein